MRTASIIGVVPSDKGIIACQCGNSIENHNKLKISVKTCSSKKLQFGRLCFFMIVSLLV